MIRPSRRFALPYLQQSLPVRMSELFKIRGGRGDAKELVAIGAAEVRLGKTQKTDTLIPIGGGLTAEKVKEYYSPSMGVS